MSEATVQCIYRYAVPGNEDLTPNEVILACDSNGVLRKNRGRTIHLDGSRSNETSFRLWCRNPTMWMQSAEGIRYRKKMNSWGLTEYWGQDLPMEYTTPPQEEPIGIGDDPVITPPNELPYKSNYIPIAIVFGFIIICWLLLMSNIVKG